MHNYVSLVIMWFFTWMIAHVRTWTWQYFCSRWFDTPDMTVARECIDRINGDTPDHAKHLEASCWNPFILLVVWFRWRVWYSSSHVDAVKIQPAAPFIRHGHRGLFSNRTLMSGEYVYVGGDKMRFLNDGCMDFFPVELSLYDPLQDGNLCPRLRSIEELHVTFAARQKYVQHSAHWLWKSRFARYERVARMVMTTNVRKINLCGFQFLQAKRDIQANEQLLSYYGPGHWLHVFSSLLLHEPQSITQGTHLSSIPLFNVIREYQACDSISFAEHASLMTDWSRDDILPLYSFNDDNNKQITSLRQH